MIYKDINNKKIKEAYEIGTKKYNIIINNRYLVRFEENEKKSRMGYSNGAFNLYAVGTADNIIVSDKKEDAMIIDGRINLKSIIQKILNDYSYLFYEIEIIEEE